MLSRPEDDATAWSFSFGNGAARGVAAMIVYMLIQEMADNADDLGGLLRDLSYISDSFISIRTQYEKHGDGSDRAAIVANIARQEQDAKVQGVSTYEWVRIILQDRGMVLGLSLIHI